MKNAGRNDTSSCIFLYYINTSIPHHYDTFICTVSPCTSSASWVSSSGRIRFRVTAVMVAITTADSPNMVFAQSGNRTRQPLAWITPIPSRSVQGID